MGPQESLWENGLSGEATGAGTDGAACSRAISGAGQFSFASVEIAKGSGMNLGGCAEVPGLRGAPPLLQPLPRLPETLWGL